MLKFIKAINWSLLAKTMTIECLGFLAGLALGIGIGFMLGYAYVIFPWGVP